MVRWERWVYFFSRCFVLLLSSVSADSSDYSYQVPPIMSRFIDCFVLVLFILTFMHLVALLGGLKEISTWELSQRLKECWNETGNI